MKRQGNWNKPISQAPLTKREFNAMMDREHAEQHANLIAAAPDLLAALEKMVWTFEKLSHVSAMKMARAAIAKAQGKI